MRMFFVTCGNVREAKKIARHLLEEKMIGCANIIPKIDSYFWWNGKIEKDSEALLLCKTLRRRYSRVIKEIKKVHSYTVPSIELVDVRAGNEDYFKWMETVLK